MQRRRKACPGREAGVATLVVAALIACASGCTPAAPPAARWPGSATLVQDRSAQGRGTVGVLLGPDRSAVVTHVRLDVGAGPVVWNGRTTIGARREVTLQLPVPPPSCPPGGSAVARIEVRVDGQDRPFVTALEDPWDAVRRLADQGCSAQALSRVARVEGVSVRTTGSGPTAHADLLVEIAPTGADGSARIERLRGTVLLRPAGGMDAAWEVGETVDAGSGRRVLRLPLEPARCDAHAIAEDKLGTVLDVEVVADGATGVVPLPLADGVAPALLSYIGSRCGL